MGSVTEKEWIPGEVLRKVSSDEIRYADGFLVSKPEKWFPGFSAYWLPIIHSLDVDARLVSSQPVLEVNCEEKHTYIGALGGDFIGVVIPQESFLLLSRILFPGGLSSAQHIAVEYFARRFLSTLGASWSASDGAQFRFDSRRSLSDVEFKGGIDVSLLVNGQELSFCIGLTQGLVDKIHSLWINHLRSQTGTYNSSKALTAGDLVDIELVLGVVGVKPTELASFLEPGSVISLAQDRVPPSVYAADAEVNEHQRVEVFLSGEPFVFGDLLLTESSCAVRSNGQVSTRSKSATFSPDATKVRALVGRGSVEKGELQRLRDSGEYLQLPFGISSSAELVVADQVVAKGNFIIREDGVGVQVTEVL